MLIKYIPNVEQSTRKRLINKCKAFTQKTLCIFIIIYYRYLFQMGNYQKHNMRRTESTVYEFCSATCTHIPVYTANSC